MGNNGAQESEILSVVERPTLAPARDPAAVPEGLLPGNGPGGRG
jgi:hypothetical protein